MQLPGIYVEIKGDYSQLEKSIRAAKNIVSEQATGISNSLNNALSPAKVRSSIDGLVANFGTLNRASVVTKDVVSNINTNVGQLAKIAGLTDSKFADLQGRLLQTQAAKAQENALRRIASVCNLTGKEVQELGAKFGLSSEQIRKVTGEAKKAEGAMFSFGSVARTAFAYFSVYELIQFQKEIVNTIVKVDSLQRSFAGITGSQKAATEEIGYLREVSDKTGQNFYNLSMGYQQLTAASKGTNLEGEKTRKVFLAVSEAAAVLGLSQDRVDLSIRALGQMASKGVVQMEELKNQLGDHIPGAVQIAARALNVTTKELYDMSRDGQLLAEDVLPAIADELHRMYGEAAQTASLESGQSAVNKLSEAWTDFKANVANSKFVIDTIWGITGAIRAMTAAMVESSNQKAGFASGFETVSEAAGILSSEEAALKRRLSIEKEIAETRGLIKKIQSDSGVGGLYEMQANQVSGLQKKIESLNVELGKMSAKPSPYITGEAAGKVDTVSAAFGHLGFKMQGVRAETEEERKASEKAHQVSLKYIETREQALEKEYQAALKGARGADEIAAVNRKYEEERSKLFSKRTSSSFKAEREGLKQLSAEVKNYADVAGEAAVAAREWASQAEKVNSDISRLVESYGTAGMGEFARINYEQALAVREAKAAIQGYSAQLSTIDEKIAKTTAAYHLANSQLEQMREKLSGNTAGTTIEDANKIDTFQDKVNGLSESLGDLYQQKERLTQNKDGASALLGNVDVEYMAERYQSAYSQIGARSSELYNFLRQQYVSDRDAFVEATGDKVTANKILEQNLAELDLSTPTTTWVRAAEIGLQRVSDLSMETGESIARATEDAFSSATDAVVQFAMKSKIEVSSLVDSIVADIMRIAVQQTITGPIASGLVGVIGGLFGGAASSGSTVSSNFTADSVFGAYHTGGIVGEEGGLRSGINPIVFNGAPKFHSGLVPGEFPAILKEGEGVFTEGQMAALGGSNVVINVIEAPGRGGQQQQRNENGVNMIDVFVEQIKASIAGDIAKGNGGIPDALAGTYGLNRAAGRY